MIKILCPILFASVILLQPLNCYPSIKLDKKTFNVDISNLISFYETLTQDEKTEQIRDWAIYGLVSELDIPKSKKTEILCEIVPMRYPFMKNKVKYEISLGRIEYISNTDCVVLIDNKTFNDKQVIGNIVDKKYAKNNYIPETINLFGYNLSPDNKMIIVTFIEAIPSKKLFTQEYNYFQKEIKSIKDLNEFISRIDDITNVQWSKDSIILAGRKYPEKNGISLTVEDIAVLYQAYNIKITPENEASNRHNYNTFINQKYEEILKQESRLRKAIKSGKVQKSQIISQIRQQIPYVPLGQEDTNVGFSLDSDYDYNNMAVDLIKLANKDSEMLTIEQNNQELVQLLDSMKVSLTNAATRVNQQHDIEPILVMRRRYNNSENMHEKCLNNILEKIMTNNSYQHARYDGRLQGTIPAMTLFYTDLLAKLWALDYNGLFPKIVGFRTMPEIKVPILYWEDFIRLSKTRLWFGLKQEGFEIYGKRLLFEPVATRVYSASSDPLFPGKESEPNYQSKEFLNWWDMHYQNVADSDPQYHRLNQIQKWGCILLIMKEEKSHILDFLFNISVSRDLDFENWYNNTNYLNHKTKVPFLDKNRYNRTTECLSLMKSNFYPLLGGNFFLSGGVSLASKKDVLSRLKKSKSQPVAQTLNKSIKTAGKEQISVKKKALKQIIKNRQVIEIPTEQNKIKLKIKVENSEMGNFSTEKQNDSIQLGWEKGEDVILNEFINSLVAIQETKQPGYKNEGIFRLVTQIDTVDRVNGDTKYLVKGKTTENRWIYLGINRKLDNYSASASGTEADSDIFYAKLLTDAQYTKLKQTIQLTNIIP